MPEVFRLVWTLAAIYYCHEQHAGRRILQQIGTKVCICFRCRCKTKQCIVFITRQWIKNQTSYAKSDYDFVLQLGSQQSQKIRRRIWQQPWRKQAWAAWWQKATGRCWWLCGSWQVRDWSTCSNKMQVEGLKSGDSHLMLDFVIVFVVCAVLARAFNVMSEWFLQAYCAAFYSRTMTQE